MAKLEFITLGPQGTCHENALRSYLAFQGLESHAEIVLVGDFDMGLEMVRLDPDRYLLQCSAHPAVNVVTERYRHDVMVVDTFIFPAKEMGLLVRRDSGCPRSLGVVPAAEGYVDLSRWEHVVEETANPIVARNLLEGRYEAGVTLVEFAEKHPDELVLAERFGEVDTTWLVFGRRRRYQGDLIGHRIPEFFLQDEAATVAARA
jgi:hypothetical protein